LRVNGYDFHQQLMAGDIAYTDPRVKHVYETWKTLIDDKYFIDNALSYDVDSISPLLVNGHAAMMLMGTFFSAGLPAATREQRFLSDPAQLDAILQRLEATRKRIYKK